MWQSSVGGLWAPPPNLLALPLTEPLNPQMSIGPPHTVAPSGQNDALAQKWDSREPGTSYHSVPARIHRWTGTTTNTQKLVHHHHQQRQQHRQNARTATTTVAAIHVCTHTHTNTDTHM
mmetsp:Transcript_72293/g.127396  ORF Transcript_72293/g.127396 Transcript_72293/m.127396 type:complete len:119 (-) Transcript_72293:113-469(-)